MKAQILRRPGAIERGPLESADLPVPEPGPGEIRLRVDACSICHTDLHTIEGELTLPKLPVVPGHQIVGIVDEPGPGATKFKKGDRIGAAWLNHTCGNCSFCQKGQENLCENARFTGLHVDGGYAQYFVVSQDFSYLLPGSFSDLEAAPLLCAGVIGYRALRLSQVKSGEVLGLYGFGASAHIVIQVALYWGCQVCVFTRSKEHQKMALRLGAKWVGKAEDTAPSKLHSAIIFAPAGILVPHALRALEKGGTLALAGVYMSPIPEMDYSLIYGEKRLRSVANSTRRDAQELIHLAEEIPIRTQVQVFPLHEANRALHLLKEGQINGAGVLEMPPD